MSISQANTECERLTEDGVVLPMQQSYNGDTKLKINVFIFVQPSHGQTDRIHQSIISQKCFAIRLKVALTS